MKLYLIHAGYYDPAIMSGLYEHHINYFVAAENVSSAKKKALGNPVCKKYKMHIDSIQELNAVDGYSIKLVGDNLADDIVIYGYNDVKNII